MEYFYLIYIVIPLFIILNVSNADSQKAQKIRLKYSIPSFLMIIFIVLMYALRYLEIIDFIELIDYYPTLFLMPLLLTLILIIFYNSGKKKERYAYIDMAEEEAIHAREKTVYNRKSIGIQIKNDDDIEIL